MTREEAPEKIWVHELSAKELNVPLKEYHIEYTRTDAFIEKAYSWLRNHYRDYMHNPTGERLEAFFGGDMCNDFEEYMKGDKV